MSLLELDLSHNQILALTRENVFGDLTALTHLNLMGNEIHELPGWKRSPIARKGKHFFNEPSL